MKREHIPVHIHIIVNLQISIATHFRRLCVFGGYEWKTSCHSYHSLIQIFWNRRHQWCESSILLNLTAYKPLIKVSDIKNRI